jgi:hypothetical protein
VSAPAPPVSVSLPFPPARLALGNTPSVSSSDSASLPSSPEIWIVRMFESVAGAPVIATAPLFTRRLPFALRETVITLAFSSPRTVSTPPADVAVTA